MKIFIFAFLLFILNFGAYAKGPFTGIRVSKDYACAYNSSTVSCWGGNAFGQVTRFDDLKNVQEIVLSPKYGCLVDEVGLACWGEEIPQLSPYMTDSGISQIQLLIESQNICGIREGGIVCAKNFTSVIPAHLTHVTSLSMDTYTSCAVQDGSVNCWASLPGTNTTYIVENIPKNMGNVVKVKVDTSSACALNDQEQLFCWGRGPVAEKFRPQANRKVKQFDLDRYYACAGFENGEVDCWGLKDLPIDLKEIRSSKFSISGLNDQFDSFASNGCFLNQNHQIDCWNLSNQSTVVDYLRVPPFVSAKIQSMTGLTSSTCFSTDKNLVCTGHLKSIPGEIPVKNLKLIDGSKDNLCFIDDSGARCLDGTIPAGHETTMSLAVGANYVCSLLESGIVECSGKNSDVTQGVPRGLKNVKAIKSGAFTVCALDVENQISCWGSAAPKAPVYDKKLKIVDFVVSQSHGCLLFEDSSIQCWLLNLPREGRSPVLDTPQLQDRNHLISGYSFACAYNDFQIDCWGNSNGADMSAPRISGKIKMATAGRNHACLQDDAGIKCWGQNYYGQYTFFQ